MQVRTARVTGIAHSTDVTALVDALPTTYSYRAQVGVGALQPVPWSMTIR